jgi:hypothetical protein
VVTAVRLATPTVPLAMARPATIRMLLRRRKDFMKGSLFGVRTDDASKAPAIPDNS